MKIDDDVQTDIIANSVSGITPSTESKTVDIKIPKDDEYAKVAALQAAQSPEARQQSLTALQEIGDKYLTVHSGLDASKALEEFDARAKSADTEIRKIYGPNTRAYRRYLANHANAHAAQRKALVSAVSAEVKHGALVAIKTDTENRINSLVETDCLDAAGAVANQAVEAEVATDNYNSLISEVDSESEKSEQQLERERRTALAGVTDVEKIDKINADFDTRKAEAGNLAVGTRAVIGDMAINELTKISAIEEAHAREKAKPLRKELRNIFMQRYKAHRAMGQSHEIAYANATEATRNGALSYFSERIKRGQMAHVLYMLDELENIGDADYKNSITDKTPTGVYDPSAYGFCRKSDLFALRKAAVDQINYYKRVQKLKMAGREEGLKVANAQIRFEADQLARQPVLDMDKMDKLFEETKKLIDAGLDKGAETSTYLRGIVERAERKMSRTQKEAEKLQTAEDFEREYEIFNEKIKIAAPMYFYSKTAEGKNLLQFTMDENGKPVHIDGQNRMILLIRNGLSRGIIKGKMWNEALEKLENDRAMEDKYAAMAAVYDAGISYDKKRTDEVIKARGGYFADMNEERGGISASSWGEDKTTHRLRVGNPQVMMYNYKDPVTGRTLPLSGLQLNDLLEEVELWQMRHPNPSPGDGDEKPKELIEFIRRALDRAIVMGTIKKLGPDEHNVPVGFGDIRLAAHREYAAYFAPKGNVRVYGRDMNALSREVLGGELPNTDTIRKFLNNPEIWTSKKGK